MSDERTVTVTMMMLRRWLKLPPTARIRVRLGMPLLGSDEAIYVDVLPPRVRPNGGERK